MRIAASTLLSLLAALLCVAPGRAQDNAQNANGLEQFGEQLATVFPFSLRNGRLQLDRSQWDDQKQTDTKPGDEAPTVILKNDAPVGPAAALVSLMKATGDPHCDGLRLHLNGCDWCDHQGGGIWGEIFSWKEGRTDLTVRQTADPADTVRVLDERNGSLRIFIDRKNGDALIYVQTASGRVAVLQRIGNETMAFGADSFLNLCKQNEKYVDTQFLPSLKRLGIRLPPLAAIFAAKPPARPEPAAEEKGTLEQVSEHVAGLVKISLKGAGLTLDRNHWYSMQATGIVPTVGAGTGFGRIGAYDDSPGGAVNAVRRIVKAAGGRDDNSLHGGAFHGQDYHHWWCDDLAAFVHATGEEVEIGLRERRGPANELRLLDDAHGSLRLVLCNKRGDIVILAQSAKGAVTVLQSAAGRTTTVSADSYADLYRRNEDWVEGRLFPALARLGVGLPPTRFSPKVLQALLSRLRPLTNQEHIEFDALLRLLDDDAQDNREAATVELARKYPRFADLVAKAVKNPPSMEAETRLGRVIIANADAREPDEFIDTFRLLDDRNYLVAALDKVADAGRAPLVRRLEELTGRKIGDDPAAWKRWIEDQPTPGAP